MQCGEQTVSLKKSLINQVIKNDGICAEIVSEAFTAECKRIKLKMILACG